MNFNRDIYAIVIGVGTFGDQPHDPRPLEDAEQIFSWLQSRKGGAIPKQNVQLLLSPSREQMEKAFYYLGASDQAQIGRLLLVYFSGYAVGTGPNDIGLLSADAGPDRLERVLGLSALRDSMEHSGSFQDYLWLVDYHCVSKDNSLGGPSWTLPDPSPEVANTLLVAHNRNLNCDPGERSRSVLSPILYRGLSGSAANRNGAITSQSLRQYVQRRFSRLRRETSPLMIDSSGEIFDILQNPDRLPAGMLTVELPAWVPSLSITDNQFREVGITSEFEETDDAQAIRRFSAELLPGIYTVTASKGDLEEQHIISILADEQVLIRLSDWKELQFEPVAPLSGGEDVPKNQTYQAADKSKMSTWVDAPPGPSRLFLFLRSTNPERSTSFASGLKLLDADGEEISDLSSGVRRNTRGGWLAFNADLPPGNYLLRRGRRGVPVRYQSIYLAEGWETHVFLVAEKNYPALANLSLGMVPLGKGFDPTNETMIVSETLVRGLASGKRSFDPDLIARARRLWQGAWKYRNLWLGIAAAYYLRTGLAYDEEEQFLYFDLMNNLRELISDHPDVRALLLEEDLPAETPFWHPPLLAAGLQMVQTHASSHASTIPVGSLTDLVLDHLIFDSPWVAWEEFTEAPRRHDEPEPPWEQISKKAPIPDVQQRILQGGKVIDLSGISEQASPQQEGLAALRDSYILNLAQQVRKDTPDQSLPETVKVDVRSRLSQALENISPIEVSRRTRINLSKVQSGIDSLLKFDPSESEPEALVDRFIQQLSQVERKVIDIAAQQAIDPTLILPPGEAADPTASLEDLASSLLTEADRTLVAGKEKDTAEKAQSVAQILRFSANSLAERSESLVLTDVNGKITRCNRQFLTLLAARVPEETAVQSILTNPATSEIVRAWEDHLWSAPLGKSALSDPALLPDGERLLLERSEVKDEANDRTFGYVNHIRRALAPIEPDQLKEIENLMPALAYFNSLYAYGAEENAEKHLEEVSNLADQINHILTQAS